MATLRKIPTSEIIRMLKESVDSLEQGIKTADVRLVSLARINIDNMLAVLDKREIKALRS